MMFPWYENEVDSRGTQARRFEKEAVYVTNKNKLRGFSPPANYTDRATAACRRS
jgi:hypothetical protein